MAEYRTKSGELIDEICYKYYGRTNEKIVELILEYNSDILSGQKARLEEGLILKLPAIEIKPTEGVSLWD